MAATHEGFDRRAAKRVLAELGRLERELVELEYVRRTDALQDARDAVSRLADLGSPAAILDRAGVELGTRSRFERVLVSRLAGSALEPRSLWIADRDDDARAQLAALESAPIAIEYPLVEAEVVQARRGQVVAAAGTRRAAPRLTDVLGWRSYVVVPVLLHGATVGLLHADAGEAQASLDDLDLDVAELFADGLAGAFERAVLRESLLHHRRSLQSAIQWIDGRLARVSADAVSGATADGAARDGGGADPLTPREAEVIALMARGLTNLAIAKTLVVREGTVKYHVKNILRKLGASSRSDAVARYARSSMGAGA